MKHKNIGKNVSKHTLNSLTEAMRDISRFFFDIIFAFCVIFYNFMSYKGNE